MNQMEAKMYAMLLELLDNDNEEYISELSYLRDKLYYNNQELQKEIDSKCKKLEEALRGEKASSKDYYSSYMRTQQENSMLRKKLDLNQRLSPLNNQRLFDKNQFLADENKRLREEINRLIKTI